jgi:hypothetical protein
MTPEMLITVFATAWNLTLSKPEKSSPNSSQKYARWGNM